MMKDERADKVGKEGKQGKRMRMDGDGGSKYGR
jgi:hypothetical protein